MKERLSGVRLKILMKLEQIAQYQRNEGKDYDVKLHCKEVARELIQSGSGSISVDRYLRYLRQEGFIDYPDPRSNGHFYKITLKYI